MKQRRKILLIVVNSHGRVTSVMKNSKLGKGRQAITLAFSFTPEQAEMILRKVAELKPRISNRSHYIQNLVELDNSQNLLGRKPFKRAGGQTSGQEEALAA